MTNTLVIARRKGTRVRMFDTRTAKMGPWMIDPRVSVRGLVQGGRRAGKANALAARKAEYEAMRERMSRLPVVHTAESLESMTNARIREVGGRILGMTFPSKARKAELVEAYLTEQTARLA